MHWALRRKGTWAVYAMHYPITLPADYDMEIIRTRITTRGPLLDHLDGLGLKAYLVRTRRATDMSNQYAPFYLWTDVDAMRHFLVGGGGFQGIVTDFGRPTVFNWTGIDFRLGCDAHAEPTRAVVHRCLLDPDDTPTRGVESAMAEAANFVEEPTLHSVAVALNADRWETVVFSLWTAPRSTDCPGQSFDVLHLSKPHMHELASSQLATTKRP
jgi:Domain of unknown function (DUF4865)